MTSSELSDALNPYANNSRPRQPVQDYPHPFHQNAIPVQNYVPHRSELELAISESHSPPMNTPQMQMLPRPMRGPSSETVHPVQEILRILNATKEVQERESQRRIAWEQDQEAKFRQRQAEMEQQINDMRRQITMLQSALTQNAASSHPGNPTITLDAASIPPDCSPGTVNAHPVTGLFTPQYSMSPAVLPSRPPQSNQPMSPVSPIPQNPTTYAPSHFVQGSSNNSRVLAQPYYNRSTVDGYRVQPTAMQMQHHSPHLQNIQQYHDAQNHVASIHQSFQQQASVGPSMQTPDPLPPSQSVTPSPSPQSGSVYISRSPRSSRSPPRNSKTSRKRSNVEITSSDSSSNSDSSESNPRHRIRRVSHHDRRCLTIHHAMRAHFLHMMQVDTDKELPDSHVEGVPLGPDDPVRFVWDKTTKQSVHNSRMKTRIMTDVKENRRLYKHVPHKDFSKKILEAVFEQCFVTFRQKFKAQRDALIAQSLRKREEAKARKARHVSRRKLKLTNRAESREKMEALEHVTFDGALQLECMSSEDSEYETDSSGTRVCVLRTRGYAWRSQRLIQFYGILDDGAQNKLKRGVGKKERCNGPLKEGFHLPPKGVASWMVSKQWMKSAQQEHPDLPNVLGKLLEEPAGFDWSQLSMLGNDTEDENDGGQPPDQQQSVIQHQQHPQQHQPTGFHMAQSMTLNYNSQPNLSIPQQHYSTGISSLDYALSS